LDLLGQHTGVVERQLPRRAGDGPRVRLAAGAVARVGAGVAGPLVPPGSPIADTAAFEDHHGESVPYQAPGQFQPGDARAEDGCVRGTIAVQSRKGGAVDVEPVRKPGGRLGRRTDHGCPHHFLKGWEGSTTSVKTTWPGLIRWRSS